MLRRLRFPLSPGWLALHLVALALVVSMVLLGRWQLEVSNAKHFNLQNFGYALQWWAFSLFVLGMWARILHDTRGRGASAVDRSARQTSKEAQLWTLVDDGPAYRRYVMPQSAAAPAPAADAEHAAYNDYLARLDADSSKTGRGEGAAP